jgi:D-glycero-D-manno-heptose 1,7-bisphosphate phosphatase
MDNDSSPRNFSPTAPTGRRDISSAKTKAVFLDRDGTIIRDAHYLSDPANVELLPDAALAIAMLRESGFLLFLFTNQSGVGRGFFPIEAVHRCNQRMMDLLGFGSAIFTDICIATESPDQPLMYRKPSPRFINESVAKHAIDPAQAWMVGDKSIDVETGINAGINAALIGNKTSEKWSGVARYDSLHAFSQAVCLRPV